MDYAGSDRLWAGVITHISNAVDQAFGKWAVKLFRTWHYKPEKDLKPYLEETDEVVQTDRRWKHPPFKVFAIPLIMIFFFILGLAFWLIFGVPHSVLSSEISTNADVATVLLTTIVGLGAAIKITDIAKMSFNLITTQVGRINAMSKKADFSASLGFMGKVKNEVYYITSVLRYMGVFLDKEIRLCLIIDDVDLLGKDKIMGLFRVVSLLQSTRNSSCLQILCMDPTIAANLIKKALSKELSSDISGHAFLRKHIQLPFYIPPLDYRPRDCAARKHDFRIEEDTARSKKCSSEFQETACLLTCNSRQGIEMNNVSSESNSKKKKSHLDKQHKIKVEESLFFNLNLSQFIDGNERALKRVTTSAQLAVHMLIRRADSLPSDTVIRNLVIWISLADQWPYRLSWIRQMIEDNAQMHRLDPHLIHKFCDDALLVDVYQLVEAKLIKPEDWKNLLDLDGDPELFLNFLQLFPFTVKDMKRFLPFTTNLNNALRTIIAQCSAKDLIIRQTALHVESSQHRWWHSSPLERWTTDDVCNEITKIGMNDRFVDVYCKFIREKNISGETLCTCSLHDLQLHTRMTPGDWNLFRSSFSALRTFYGISCKHTKRSSATCSGFEEC